MPYPPPSPSRTPARLAAVRRRVPVGLKSDLRGAGAPAIRLGPLLALSLLAAAPSALAVLAAPGGAGRRGPAGPAFPLVTPLRGVTSPSALRAAMPG